MFSRLKRAWAVWVLSSQSFAATLNNSFGYDRKNRSTSLKIANKREAFTEELSIRLQTVQVESTDALRVIRSRDYAEAFHYCDPPYFNSDCGHYDGYTKKDFEMLLKTLSRVEGKFLLSSYQSDMLKDYTKQHNWQALAIEQKVSVANGTGKPGKRKTEILTANYDLKNPGLF